MGSPPAFHEGVLVNNVILLWHGVIVVASTPPHHPFFEQVVVDIVTSFETRYSYGVRLSYYVSNGFFFFIPFYKFWCNTLQDSYHFISLLNARLNCVFTMSLEFMTVAFLPPWASVTIAQRHCFNAFAEGID